MLPPYRSPGRREAGGLNTDGANKMKPLQTCLVALALLAGLPAAHAAEVASRFSGRDSIVNTRHNLTQGPIGGGRILMDPHRNDYEQVCVYCHTPHGANPQVDAPLWNRTATGATYTTYDELGTSTLTQPVTAPGVNSLTCLSCHDGTLGIDSIINMPNTNSAGAPSANYSVNQFQAPMDVGFLNSWQNVSGNSASHAVLGSEVPGSSVGCMVCHSEGSGFNTATDFDSFVIGEDLRNDHPIGVRFPVGSGADFNQPAGSSGGMLFFDKDSDSRADSNEIRLYDTGDGPEVECASCHDPHGVKVTDGGSELLPSFLRVSNQGSGVCLTCHIK